MRIKITRAESDVHLLEMALNNIGHPNVICSLTHLRLELVGRLTETLNQKGEGVKLI
jgi:hypothetical protein